METGYTVSIVRHEQLKAETAELRIRTLIVC